MTNANNTIAQAINNAITSFKNGWDNANNLPNQNNGGFSLSIFFNEDANEFSAEVEFSQDTSKTVWIDNGMDDETVNALWNNDANAIICIAENFDQEWIELV